MADLLQRHLLALNQGASMSRIAKAVILTLVLSVPFVPSLTRAQRTGEMTFGVMAGVQFSTLSQDPEATEVEYSHKTGLLAGAFLGIPLTGAVSIEPQALFSQKGADVKGTGANSAKEGSIRINYIEVPVLLKLSFPGSMSSVTPFVFAGPAVAFKVSCKAEGVILAITGDRDCEETELFADVKSTDFSGTVGAGIKFGAMSQVFILDARYTHGFTNIIDDSSGNRDIKNRAFA